MERQKMIMIERRPWIGNTLLFTSFVIILIIFSGSAVASQAAFTEHDGTSLAIMVNDMANVTGETILLKDVAFIKSSDKSLKEKLGGVEIGDSPKPGHEKRISGRWIHSMIRSAINSESGADIDVPEIILVKREFQVIPEDKLFSLFEDYLEREFQDGEVKISQFKIRGANIFSTGHVELSPLPDNKRNMGMVNLSVNVVIDEKFCGSVLLSGQVDVYKKVVCAKTYVKRGATLAIEDVGFDVINISKAPVDTINDINDAVGKYVKTNLREGAFLRASMLDLPPLIEKGDKVKLVAGKGALTVITMGIAKTGGPEGAQIRVKNVASGKVVVGRVKDEFTVEVLF
ncbi:MAG: flagellar basal body P-ring formation chaperone FlgA [Proteobacteria bacterium]|nr:flagellar basal body P-ring formation chaperone FlgA [Pseudomonadota bacterium]